MVEDVMNATAAALASAGYAALRIDDVAARSGVNKTTIYRRWPTKADLVAAALAHLRPELEPPNTGSLRGDLLAMLHDTLVACATPIGRGILRMLQSESADPEVEALTRSLRRRVRGARERRVQRAIDSGELPSIISAPLVIDMIMSPIVLRAIMHGEPVSEADAEAIVDTVLAGVRACASGPC